VVDETMRTSVAGIWAAGDVVEGIQLTPVGSYQAQSPWRTCSTVRGWRLRGRPTAIFTDPELAQVGLTEAEAREAGHETESVTHHARDLLRPYYGIGRNATRAVSSSSSTSATPDGYSGCTR